MKSTSHSTPTSGSNSAQSHPSDGLVRYVRDLTLTNVRTFQNGAKLSLCFPDGKLAQWTVILGKNGTGKTTLLQYLAGMTPVINPDKTDWIPYFTTREGGADQLANVKKPIEPNKQLQVEVTFTEACYKLEEAKGGIPKGYQWTVGETTSQGTQFFVKGLEENPIGKITMAEVFFIGYGAGRHVAGPASPYLAQQVPFLTNVNTLFNDDVPLISPEQWLLSLDHLSKTDGPNQTRSAASKSHAIRCLCEILPDVEKILVEPGGYLGPQDQSPNMRVFFETHYGKVTFESLSLGYRTTAAWVIDLIRRLHGRYPMLEAPEKGPCVVMVDEFDLHMHVEWQSTMMTQLGKAFPNTQFIVTAHSPLVVQAADGRANLAVLKKVQNEDGTYEVIIENDPGNVSGWRVDQLLESDLFGGLPNRSPKYLELFRKRTKLRQNPHRTAAEEAEMLALEARLDVEAPVDTDPGLAWLEARLEAFKLSKKPAPAKRKAKAKA